MIVAISREWRNFAMVVVAFITLITVLAFVIQKGIESAFRQYQIMRACEIMQKRIWIDGECKDPASVAPPK